MKNQCEHYVKEEKDLVQVKLFLLITIFIMLQYEKPNCARCPNVKVRFLCQSAEKSCWTEKESKLLKQIINALRNDN